MERLLEIARIARTVEGALDEEVIAATKKYRLTGRQALMLAAIAETPGCSLQDLIRATGMERSTAGDQLAELATAKLVRRKRKANDLRTYQLALTDEGAALATLVRPAAQRAELRVRSLIDGLDGLRFRNQEEAAA